jgi:hypothetical protein
MRRGGERESDVAVGGKAGPPLEPWQEIGSPSAGFTFSAAGKRYAYVAAGEFAIPALKVKDAYYSARWLGRPRRSPKGLHRLRKNAPMLSS